MGAKADSRLARRLAMYSTVAGALIAAEGADAAPIIVDPEDIVVGPNETVFLDLNDDMIDDFAFFHKSGANSYTYSLSGAYGLGDNQVLTGDGDLKLRRLGTEIGPGSEFWNDEGLFAKGKTDGEDEIKTGKFKDGEPGFIGVMFDIPGGSSHYGWVEASIMPGSTSDPDSNVLTIHRWAYESEAMTSITTPVPEPSPLALLAAGAAGMLLWRRRRRTA